MWECDECGVVFFERSGLVRSDYQEYYPYLTRYGQSEVDDELGLRRRHLRRQLGEIGRYTRGRTLLDVGAGPGYYCKIAAEEGWDVTGVELSDQARQVGERYLGVRYRELGALLPETFDVVCCHHVLERVFAPLEFLGELRSKLTSGGLLVVHTPHREPLSFALRNVAGSLRGSSADRLCALYASEHVTGFTRQALIGTMSRAGFQPLLVKTRSMWSKYYDPFFFRASLRRSLVATAGRIVRHAVDNCGVVLGRGDWIIGLFRKVS
jgi:2-polyprenyl-3-methyl-5-hydroxy-6-metoxy-1,4-benzoquinol methylase